MIPDICDVEDGGGPCGEGPQYMAEPLEGDVPCTLYACGDAEHVLHIIGEVLGTTGYPAVVSPVIVPEAVSS